MHINGLVTTKQFYYHIGILNGFVAQLVGRTNMLGISFLNSNKGIVVLNPNQRSFFYYIFFILFRCV